MTPDDPSVYDQQIKIMPFPEKFDLKAIGRAEAPHALYKDSELGTILKNKDIDYIGAQKNKSFFNLPPPISIILLPRHLSLWVQVKPLHMEILNWLEGKVLAAADEEGRGEIPWLSLSVTMAAC
jgi:hypothetical protein